ncbi:MAG: GTPase-associated system all-helical protein GASH [Bacteroidota bacterium]
MSYSPNDLFPDWYKSVDINLDEKVISNRKKAIRKVITKTNIDFWLDVVKIHFGIKPKESNKQEFVNEFRIADVTFPILDNDNLIKCLASIALCFKLEKENSNLNNVISLAILNTNALGQFEPINHIPVNDFANQNLINIPKDELIKEEDISRLDEIKNQLTLEEDEENGDEEESEDDTDEDSTIQLSNEEQVEIITTVQSLARTNLKLLEETNVLWWIFGEYTTVTNQHFKDAGSQKMALAASKELSDLIQVSIGIASAKQLLNKVLLISNEGKTNNKKCNVPEVIKAFDDEHKNKMLKDKKGLISEATPYLMALNKSIGFAEGENWVDPYKRSNYNGDIEKEFELLTLSYQFYREFIFLKLLKLENAGN